MLITLSHDAPILVLVIMLALQQAGDIVVIDEEERTFPECVYGIAIHDLRDAAAMEFIITNGGDVTPTSEGSHELLVLLDARSIASHMRSTARIRDGPFFKVHS